MWTSWVGSCLFCRRKQVTQNPFPCIFKRRPREATSHSCIKHSTGPRLFIFHIFGIISRSNDHSWEKLQPANHETLIWFNLSPLYSFNWGGTKQTHWTGCAHKTVFLSINWYFPVLSHKVWGSGGCLGRWDKTERRKRQYWVVKCCLNDWSITWAGKWNATRNCTSGENTVLVSFFYLGTTCWRIIKLASSAR